jgi:hypothetical protein
VVRAPPIRAIATHRFEPIRGCHQLRATGLLAFFLEEGLDIAFQYCFGLRPKISFSNDPMAVNQQAGREADHLE